MLVLELGTEADLDKYCGEFDNWGAVMSVSSELLCSFELLKPLDSNALKSHIKKGRNKRQQMLNSPVCDDSQAFPGSAQLTSFAARECVPSERLGFFTAFESEFESEAHLRSTGPPRHESACATGSTPRPLSFVPVEG